MEKIIRSICAFTDTPGTAAVSRLHEIAERLTKKGFTVQTQRICSPVTIKELEAAVMDQSLFMSVGTLTYDQVLRQLPDLLTAKNVSCNLDLTSVPLEQKYVQILFDIINQNPRKTFNFAYVFNHAHSSPFFPSAAYHVNGFAVGLQSTNLSEGCASLQEWLQRMKAVWNEIMQLCGDEKDFLGIDSSVAPLYSGLGSLVDFLRRLKLPFPNTVTTDLYVTITNFLKENNPRPVGLCGLMLPCLEDFALAEEYEKGEFTLERNLYLSLHSGLGIDTYPIGVDEKPERILQILMLVRALAKKHNKPLAVRFVSDGTAKIGERTECKNQYLKDVVVRAL